MGRRRTTFETSLADNMAMFWQYRDALTELAISTFEWKNLPETIDARFLEMILFRNGGALFFKDDVLGFLALPYATAGKLDIYNIPIRRRAYSNNGFSDIRTNKDSVIIFNNMLRKNSVQLVEVYARRLWDLDRSIDVNARAQKTPVVLQVAENQRLTALNLYKEVDGNAPVILADKNLDLGSALKSISTAAPFVADKLYQLKTEIWNEALTRLGIPNISFQKKERMITDEVQRLQGGTIASRYSRLEMRKRAAEQINQMFDLNIEVDYKDMPGAEDPEEESSETDDIDNTY